MLVYTVRVFTYSLLSLPICATISLIRLLRLAKVQKHSKVIILTDSSNYISLFDKHVL